MYRIYRNQLGQFRNSQAIRELKKKEERSIFLFTIALMVYIPLAAVLS
jgi:hypothetical protein